MRNLGDHPPDLRPVGTDDLGIDLPQTQSLGRLPLPLGIADQAADQRDAQRALGALFLCRRGFFHCHITSFAFPLFWETSSGFRSCCSALRVALATLKGLLLRVDLVRMSLIPASSTITRTAPPAITPVPLDAGRRMTVPAPSSPRPRWGRVVPSRCTGMRRFLAASTALEMAMGTSRALPLPTPTIPCSLPTAATAEKLRFFPPLTTLVTRRMDMTWSLSSNSSVLAPAGRFDLSW